MWERIRMGEWETYYAPVRGALELLERLVLVTKLPILCICRAVICGHVLEVLLLLLVASPAGCGCCERVCVL